MCHGSATGLSATYDWRAESNSSNREFGSAVAFAGDINGDSYSEVIVGAHYYSVGQLREGAAFVWRGGSEGLGTYGTPAHADWWAQADQPEAELGYSVATAGDVNSDGFSDVIIGAPYYSAGQTEEGRAFVFFGAGAGVGGTAWTAESNRAGARFGLAVSAAGDVNGDGFSDILVGCPDCGTSAKGFAFIWLGSASGFGPSGDPRHADWNAESEQAGADFGASVACAGDVNSDGYSDVLVGAPLWDDTGSDEGRAKLFYGNERAGLDRIPRQLQYDESAPIGLLGASDDFDKFALKVRGRTPAGRSMVWAQWEIQPFGMPFNGTLLHETWWHYDTGIPGSGGSAVEIPAPTLGLDPGAKLHWRIRIVTESPYFPRSVWFTHPGNNRTELDLRTRAIVDGDGDGHLNTEDCDDANNQVWAIPGEVRDLRFDADRLTLHWTAPADPGGTAGSILYDTLRSQASYDFLTMSDCIESDDGTDTQATVTPVPGPGKARYFLVRAQNACGQGTLGSSSSGVPRQGRDCP